ncbi:MAG: hypothetical protein ACP5NC_07280, partial [Nitrososphaeria archaeon]
LEIKAAEGVPLEQVSRYLMDISPLILVRVLTGDVITLYPRELDGYVEFLAELMADKASRLIAGSPFVVPGYQCYQCQNVACHYNKFKPRGESIVKPANLDWDLKTFFKNIPEISERTAIAVIRELERNGLKKEV